MNSERGENNNILEVYRTQNVRMVKCHLYHTNVNFLYLAINGICGEEG